MGTLQSWAGKFCLEAIFSIPPKKCSFDVCPRSSSQLQAHFSKVVSFWLLKEQMMDAVATQKVEGNIWILPQVW